MQGLQRGSAFQKVAPARLVPADRYLVANADEWRRQPPGVSFEHREDVALGKCRRGRFDVQKRRPAILLTEAAQLARCRRALVQVDEVHLDPALLEEAQ